MDRPPPDLPTNVDDLRAFAAAALAQNADDAATISEQKLEIAKLKRQIYGPRSERSARLIEQMELELEDLGAAATEAEISSEHASAKTTTVVAFERKRPSRQPFPAHLPRERVVVPGDAACPCCGSNRLRKLGETVTETLEVIPRQWKVIQHVREKMTCRDCEKISEPPHRARSLTDAADAAEPRSLTRNASQSVPPKAFRQSGRRSMAVVTQLHGGGLWRIEWVRRSRIRPVMSRTSLRR